MGVTSFPPYYIIDENQKFSGILTNIVEKTLKKAELEYQLEEYPIKRLYKNLGAGKIHLFIGIKGPSEFDQKVLYSNSIISQIQIRIYAKGNTPLPKKKEDIKNHHIITILGYSYGGLVDYLLDPANNIKVTSASEHLSSFLMLKNNRADYLINYKHPSENVLKNLTIPELKYMNYYSADVYFIISKTYPNADEMLNKIEQAYLKLVEIGELEYISNEND